MCYTSQEYLSLFSKIQRWLDKLSLNSRVRGEDFYRLPDQWILGISPVIVFSLLPTRLAPISSTGTLLLVNLDPEHIHVFLSAPCAQPSDMKATGFQPAYSPTNPFLSLSFVNILLGSWMLALPKPHMNLDLVPGKHRKDVSVGLAPRSAPIQPSLLFSHHYAAPSDDTVYPVFLLYQLFS